jgi:hypothetical protein
MYEMKQETNNPFVPFVKVGITEETSNGRRDTSRKP